MSSQINALTPQDQQTFSGGSFVKRWDIFCNVIDNYGDIGVCWRLARQLSTEHGLAVRLWVDNLATLRPLCPEIDPGLDTQSLLGIEIRQWTSPFPETSAADVVIEAFGCELPANYLAAMAQRPAKPVWINLEYLSAEPWVEGCHALPSPHPRLPLTKHFFFPGFTPATGGLLREQGLLKQRDLHQRHPAHLWSLLSMPAPAPDETIVSLFCYDTAPIAPLLDAWIASNTPVCCLLPEGKGLAAVADYFGRPLAVHDTLTQGSLTIRIVPFLRQEDYDLLLWACDCNFVRGEDSFVRAQWAGKPLVWQIYVQEGKAHLVKLDAFLERYCQGLPPEAAESLQTFHRAWNTHAPLDWDGFWQHHADLNAHARDWAKELATQADLASNLVIFCENRV